MGDYSRKCGTITAMISLTLLLARIGLWVKVKKKDYNSSCYLGAEGKL